MKNIVFVGGSRGIGKEIIKNLSKKNNLINLSRSKSNLKNVKDIRCDLSSFLSIKRAFKKIKKIDILINNASISSYSKNHLDNFNKIIDVNLKGIYYCCYFSIPKLLNNKQSVILNIGSINAYAAFPNNPGYVSTKAALLSLTRSLALDYGSKGLRANSISPGYLKEGMAKKSYINKTERKKRLNRMIIKRFGTHTDLIGLIELLIGEKSSYITGQDFIVDGGWIAKGL